MADPLNLVALAVGMVWGCIALFFRPAGDFGVETDFYGGFARYSRMWMQGEPNLMDGYRGPGYYLTLGALALLVRDSFLAAKIISVTGAALGLRAVGALLRRLWGTRVAVAGCLAVAASPSWIDYSYRACSDLMFWGLFWAGAFLVFRAALDGRRRDWVLAGLLAGAAWLTRYSGAALAPVALASVLILVRPWRRAATGLGLFAVSGAVVIAPWCAYLVARTGDPFWSNSHGVIGAGLLVDPPSLATVGGFAPAVDLAGWGEVFAVYPEQTFAALLRNGWQHLWLDAKELLGWPWAAAVVLGLIGHARGGPRGRQAAFALAGAGIYAAMLPVFYSPRFMLVLLPVYAAAIGGLVAGAEWAADRRGWRFAPRAVIGALALAAVVATARGVIASQDPKRHGGLATEIQALAEEVRRAGEPVGPATPIAARKPHLGYYLNAPTIPVGEGSFDGIRDRGGHYLLISGIEAGLYPAFVSLWNQPDTDAVPASLRFVARGVTRTGDGDRVATLYAVRDPLPYTPRKPNPLRSPDPPRPGLSRIDDLRLRLAAWYTAWNAEADVPRLLDRLDPGLAGHPDVRTVRGDVALEAGDLDLAAEHYRAALSEDTPQERVLLRLASVAVLQRDNEEFKRRIDVYLGLQDSTAAPRDYTWWDRVGMEYMARREHAACLAVFVAGLSTAPSNPQPLKRLAYTFYELQRQDDARGVLLRYLSFVPTDAEAISLLRVVDPEALEEHRQHEGHQP